MTPTQRKAMYAALGALESPRSQQSWYQRSIDDAKAATELRNALKEDNEVSFDNAEPAPEPDRYVWEEYDRYSHGWGWSENTTEYDPRSAEKKQYHSCTDFNNPEQVRNFRALYAAPVREPAPEQESLPSKITEEMHQAACKVLVRANGLDGTPQRMLDAMRAVSTKPPAEPAPVPLLTVSELFTILSSQPWADNQWDYERAIEQAVRQNAGL